MLTIRTCVLNCAHMYVSGTYCLCQACGHDPAVLRGHHVNSALGRKHYDQGLLGLSASLWVPKSEARIQVHSRVGQAELLACAIFNRRRLLARAEACKSRV
jgi:hypothetical protein